MGPGGIAGVCIGGKVTECKNENDIEGNANVGGIVGFANEKSLSGNFEIIDCNNSGIVTSTGYNTISIHTMGANSTWNSCAAGGIIGYGIKTKVTNCYNTNLVTTSKNNTVQRFDVGGIAGTLRNSEITKSYNIGTIKGDENHVGSIGGIAGTGFYNVKVNNCYNEGEVSGYASIGGIVGIGNMMDIRYCYNKGEVTAFYQTVGGIVGHLQPWNSNIYENFIYYCYNKGTVTGTDRTGSINGYFYYMDADYIYSLEKVTQSNNNWGGGSSYINATKQGIFNKETLISTVLSEFGENFKQDYEGSESVNDGFPILTWQVQKSKMPQSKTTNN